MGEFGATALNASVGAASRTLERAHEAREAALPACRKVIQHSGSAIKAAHRLEPDEAERWCVEAERMLRVAQGAVSDHPAVAHAGFVADAEKEFVEARVVLALLEGGEPADWVELQVSVPSWLRGMAEAASELRRHLLDRLRLGELEVAEELFSRMEIVYDALMVVDFPDAITGGLRRTLDALRGVLERTRADLTTTTLQVRLQRSVDAQLGSPTPPSER